MKKLLCLILALMMLISATNLITSAKGTNSVGDINGDDRITAADARLALRFAASLEKPTDEQEKAADVNKDNKITASDARLILRVAAGLDKFKTEDAETVESENLDKLLGTYQGSYFANQGETGLTLTVYKEDGLYKAIFDFYNLPGKSNSESGKYYMNVTYNMDSDEYVFSATEWIEHPSDYILLDLKGKLNGALLRGDSPTKFAVVKEGANVKAENLDKLIGTYSGSYFANQGEVGLTLTVYKENETYKAIFDFYNLPGKNNSKSGKYYMNVTYDIYSDEYVFSATEWISRPSNYLFMDLTGKLNNTVLSGNSPTKFSVTKVIE